MKPLKTKGKAKFDEDVEWAPCWPAGCGNNSFALGFGFFKD